jgi:hypothetical protein
MDSWNAEDVTKSGHILFSLIFIILSLNEYIYFI